MLGREIEPVLIAGLRHGVNGPRYQQENLEGLFAWFGEYVGGLRPPLHEAC